MKAVVKISGSVFPKSLETDLIKSYAAELRALREEGHGLIVVTGGGANARNYIRALRELGGSESHCDEIGIRVSRLNALLLISALGDAAHPLVPEDLGQLLAYFSTGKIVVMGGLQPGHSTNAVAALAAEAIRADLLVNATDVDGIYTTDPKADPFARKLDEIGARELLKMVLQGSLWAGAYELIDPVAVGIIARSKIPALVVNGMDPKNLTRALRGERIGTKIIP
ncbi:MAG: UMP kinase [Candidatus Bathyarchaeia archaeon]